MFLYIIETITIQRQTNVIVSNLVLSTQYCSLVLILWHHQPNQQHGQQRNTYTDQKIFTRRRCFAHIICCCCVIVRAACGCGLVLGPYDCFYSALILLVFFFLWFKCEYSHLIFPNVVLHISLTCCRSCCCTSSCGTSSCCRVCFCWNYCHC